MREKGTLPRRIVDPFETSSLSRHRDRRELDDPRWHLAQRIAVSRSMGRSPLLSDFLLYVCDRHIRDKSTELTEQRIGVKVFGRTEGYNSNDDNIVRNYARTLRKRVDEYFATEGRHEKMRLEIPRGGYVPVFSSCSIDQPILQLHGEIEQLIDTALGGATEQKSEQKRELQPVENPLPEVIASATEKRIKPWRQWAAIVLAILSLIVGTSLLVFHRFSSGSNAKLNGNDSEESAALWGQLFERNRDTFLVPADSGLVILQGLTQQPVALTDYASGSYRATESSSHGISATAINELGTRRYTSIVDLNLVSHFSRLKEIVPERLLIRYARDLRMDDLRSGNVILLGSVDSNPWEELFEQQLNFRFNYSPKADTAPTIRNQHPLPGEKPIYANSHVGAWYNTFGRIAYLPNLDGSGHVLLIGGLNMAGTQAAGDFVLNPSLMKPVLDKARTQNGGLRPFELLIETDNVAANASRPHIVSERIGPA